MSHYIDKVKQCLIVKQLLLGFLALINKVYTINSATQREISLSWVKSGILIAVISINTVINGIQCEVIK